MMVQFDLAQAGANAPLFAATFAIPDGLLDGLSAITTTLSLASPIPLIRIVIDAVASLLALTTEAGDVLCAEDGSPLIWP